MLDRAYSVLTIKSFDADQRVITGIATTPTPDRLGDILEPLGVTYTNPLPLLLHHDPTQPVGTVIFDPPTPTGITFRASLPFVTEAGRVRDRVDEAWHSLKAGLIRGASVGLKPLETKPRRGGLHILKSLIAELSLVTIPANIEATVLTVKAASGPLPPGVSGTRKALPMTIQEQVTQFRNTRAAHAARMADLMAKAAETGETLDASATDEYDDLALKVKSIDAHLVRLDEQERLQIVGATRITPEVKTAAAAADVRSALPVIQVKSMLPKGTAFTRYAIAMARGKGDYMATMEAAKAYTSTTPEVELMVKAAVAAGTTTDAAWAGPLAVVQPLVNEFLELLRPKTLIGRIPGLRQVPFNVSVPSQTGGGTYSWVGQGAPKPVTAAQFGTITVPFAKAAGIIVLTEELVKLSSPSAEQTIRDEMIAGMQQFLDGQFITPTVAAVANVNPASITNAAPTAAASGVTGAAAKADLAKAVAAFSVANIPLSESVWIMSDANAWGIATSINALGQPLFAGTSPGGGTLYGRPVIVSNVAASNVVLVHAPSILFADEGGVKIDVSREASLQMDSAPMDPADATTVYVSLWQNNYVGLRAERMITWIRARTAAVYYLSAAAYNGT